RAGTAVSNDCVLGADGPPHIPSCERHLLPLRESAKPSPWGGPGTAYDATTVYLGLTKSGQHPIVDFLFPDPFCQRQVLVFSQEYATINLTMKWVSPTHLDVAYGPSSRPGDQVSIVFQVVKCAGVDISF